MKDRVTGFFVLAIVYLLSDTGAHTLGRAAVNDSNYEGSDRTKCPSREHQADQPADRSITSAQLRQLRLEMRHIISVEGPPLDAYIVTSDDDHQSNIVAARDARRAYISGFSGLYGDVVVTQQKAVLWTNPIYRVQADRQLSCDWELMINGDENVPTIFEWLLHEFRFNETQVRIGADPALVPASIWSSWQEASSNTTVTLVAVNNNLIDMIWQTNRPPYKPHAAFVLQQRFTGESWQEKVERVRIRMKEARADALVVTALDEIAWLLNLRGYDVPHTPVLRAYLILTFNGIHLYAPKEKFVRSVHVHLKTDGCFSPECVRIHDYSSIWDDLKTMVQAWNLVWLPGSCGYAKGASQKIVESIPTGRRLVKVSPIIVMRAKKNDVEIEGMRRAHVRDAVAMCEFLAYMEEQISLGTQGWDELQVARLANEVRWEKDECMDTAFGTVAGYGPNGALPLYEPANTTNLNIGDDSTLVVASGGQYRDGTTDVTRTLHYGKPTTEQKQAYTRVLIGLIQFSSLIFPASLRTDQLDALARQPMWAAGADYHHETGHGIGHFLSVHEAPIAVTYDTRIASNATCDAVSLEAGYFLSNEPGLYNSGKFGARLGNVLGVVNAPFSHKSTRKFLKFEDVTLVPFEPKLIDLEMLSQAKRQWLNEYNQRIRDVIGGELTKLRLVAVFDWMMNKTENIPELETVKTEVLVGGPPALNSSIFPKSNQTYFAILFIFHTHLLRRHVTGMFWP